MTRIYEHVTALPRQLFLLVDRRKKRFFASNGPSVVPVCALSREIPALQRKPAMLRILLHCWLFPSVPSDFTGAIAGDRHCSTGTIERHTTANSKAVAFPHIHPPVRPRSSPRQAHRLPHRPRCRSKLRLGACSRCRCSTLFRQRESVRAGHYMKVEHERGGIDTTRKALAGAVDTHFSTFSLDRRLNPKGRRRLHTSEISDP